MDESPSYAVVFSGELLDGFQLISVKAHMAKMLKADTDKMQKLFSGKQIVIKRTTDKQEALRYGNALRKAGADIKIKIVKATPSSTPETPSIQAPNKLELRENQGNIFDGETHQPKLDLDLSQYQVAENDGTPIIPETPFEPANLDLSAYSVASNDGSPLIEASAPVAKLAAPDLTLDAPGAMLETIKPDVELLNPDTSALSVSEPGADLLSDADKPAPTANVSPDTSKLSLKNDF